MTPPIIPIRASTQEFTEIVDIDRDLIIFVGGSAAMILSTSAVNFGLLSEKEQDAIIYAYAGFLNSLSFPVQILVRTQHKDISSYLRLLEERGGREKNPKLATSIKSYRRFVESTVKEKEVLDKKFYIVIPFSALELGPSPVVLFGGKKRGLPYPKDHILDRAATVLSPKRDHVMRLLARIGLRAQQLTTERLMGLFFSFYNPGAPAPGIESPNKSANDKSTNVKI